MFSTLLHRLAVAWPRLAPQAKSTRLVGAVTVALAAAAGAFVLRFGSNCPVQDEWDLVAPVFARPVRWAAVWEYHNEHRYALARTLWTSLLLATGFNFRAGMLATVLLQTASAVAMLTLVRRLRGRTRAADVLIPAVLLHWGHAFNFLMSYQVAFTLVVACAVGLLGVAAAAEPGRERRTGVWAGGVLMLAVLNGGFGLATAPPVALWIVYLAWRAKSVWPLVPVLAAAGYVGFTLTNQPPSAVVTGRLPMANLLQAAADYLASATGPVVSAGRYRLLPSYLVAVLYAVPVVVGLRAVVTLPAERPRAVGLLAVLAGHLLTTAGLAVARGGGWAPHYVTVSGVGFCAGWLLVARYGPPAGRWFGRLSVVAAGLVVGFNAAGGAADGQVQRGYFKEMTADVAAGLPPTFVAGKYGWNTLVTPAAATALPHFARTAGPLAAVVPDPPVRAVAVAGPSSLPAWYGDGEPPAVAVPAPPGAAVGLRLTVANAYAIPWAAWELTWTAADGSRRRATAYPPNLPTARHDVTFRVAGPAADVRLRPLCPTGGYDLLAAAWLVEP